MDAAPPKILNALMKHLRNSGIAISVSTQKQKLKNIGYYHGYKGYLFAGKANNKLPIDDFSQIINLHDMDMQIKGLLYLRIMQIETSLKNYTLESVLKDANSAVFEDIWHKNPTGYRRYLGSSSSAR